jgi:putative spermidine/putrescine transport system ATP-binding protein
MPDSVPPGPAPAAGAGGHVSIERLTKRFGALTAVDDLTLDIPAGSFVTLLGPSGSGKTTTLNLIAGFLSPDAGEIRFDGVPVSRTPPHRRNIGMVFQFYALFPHMTVFDNVAYPLRMRERLTREVMRRRVAETLALVQLSGFGDRYPRQLSGGQQQRVAMARALVSRPRLLLMDEPLGALDKKLREQLQSEIKQIHRRMGSTFIYVTHDQSEAMTMSDLVVVMHESRISQVGHPRDIYEAPKSEFVADFLGGANLLPGRFVRSEGEVCEIELDGGRMTRALTGARAFPPGAAVSVFIRPEDIRIPQAKFAQPDEESVRGVIRDVVFLGEALRLSVVAGPLSLSVRAPRTQSEELHVGREVLLVWSRARSRVLPSGERR